MADAAQRPRVADQGAPERGEPGRHRRGPPVAAGGRDEEAPDHFDESTSNIKRMQQAEQELKDSLRVTSTHLEVAKQEKDRADVEKSALRQQLADLQEALELAKRGAPIVNGELTNGTNGVAPPIASGLINLVANKKVAKRRSAGAEPREMDRYSMAYNPRPVSMAVTGPPEHDGRAGLLAGCRQHRDGSSRTCWPTRRA